MPGWFGEHSIAPRGPRVTPTASATLLMPIWRRARDRLSNTMSFASADVTCGGNGGSGRWRLGRPRRAASQRCHPPLAARENRTRCVNRNGKAQRSSCNGMRRLRCHGTLCGKPLRRWPRKAPEAHLANTSWATPTADAVQQRSHHARCSTALRRLRRRPRQRAVAGRGHTAPEHLQGGSSGSTHPSAFAVTTARACVRAWEPLGYF